MDISAIILSGGKSSRFGMDKGLYIFQNQALADYAIQVCKHFTNNILLISNNDEYQKFGYQLISDIYPNSGPMGGIHTGLVNTTSELNLIISCDTPFVQKEMIQMLLDEYNNEDILITSTSDGKHQTLIGLYHSRIKDRMESELKSNHLKLIKFIRQTNHRIIQIPADHHFNKCFINFNYQSEVNQYER